jgi:hypothetical protein
MIVVELVCGVSSVQSIEMLGAVEVPELLRVVPLSRRVGRVAETRRRSRHAVRVAGVLFGIKLVARSGVPLLAYGFAKASYAFTRQRRRAGAEQALTRARRQVRTALCFGF